MSDIPTTCTGRACRPSEKIQAMLDDQQQEKQKQDQEAMSKAKRREVLMCKHEQASQAAKTDLRAPAAMSMQVDRACMSLPVQTDSAFTARAIITPSTEHSNPRSALASPLVLRRANVPPVAGKKPVRPIAALLARACLSLTRTPSMWNVLEYDANSYDETPTQGLLTGCKRVREREPTPFPYEQMDDDEPNLYDHPSYPAASSIVDEPSNELPRKRVRRDLAFHEKDETGESTNELCAMQHSWYEPPSLTLDGLKITSDSGMPSVATAQARASLQTKPSYYVS
ncbi:hypothetical protein BKA83DRAFT_4486323 [Pisolithus microcarpus]|nr:hypothetical protein BKA83DRAFT_4486323 [Pisolithus microcarpus]